MLFRKKYLNGHPGNVSRPIKRVITRGVKAGLVVTATTDGVHAINSWHYPRWSIYGLVGKAVDLGLPARLVGTDDGRRLLIAFQTSEFNRRGHRYAELLGPNNKRCIKNGHVMQLAEGSALETAHDTHVHAAVAYDN